MSEEPQRGNAATSSEEINQSAKPLLIGAPLAGAQPSEEINQSAKPLLIGAPLAGVERRAKAKRGATVSVEPQRGKGATSSEAQPSEVERRAKAKRGATVSVE